MLKKLWQNGGYHNASKLTRFISHNSHDPKDFNELQIDQHKRVVAMATHRMQPVSDDYVILKPAGRYYTDFGKVLHDNILGNSKK